MTLQQKTRTCPYLEYNEKSGSYFCVIGTQENMIETGRFSLMECVWHWCSKSREFAEMCPRGHNYREIERTLYDLVKIHQPEEASKIPLCEICGHPSLIMSHKIGGKNVCHEHHWALWDLNFRDMEASP